MKAILWLLPLSVVLCSLAVGCGSESAASPTPAAAPATAPAAPPMIIEVPVETPRSPTLAATAPAPTVPPQVIEILLTRPAPTFTASPTNTPSATATPDPAPLAAACEADLAEGGAMLAAHDETGEGDCGEGIRLLLRAIERADAALAIAPNHPEACLCRDQSRLRLEHELTQAVADLECAVAGLDGARRDQAQAALAAVREILDAPVRVSMGPVVFAENWDGDVPINPATSFPAGATHEAWAQWSLTDSSGEVAIVKWYHDGELFCQHHTDVLIGDWTFTGSGWVADEEWIDEGDWCVYVLIGDTVMTHGCFTIE